MTFIIFLIVIAIAIFVIAYRNRQGESVYKYISKYTGIIYEKYAPYSFKVIREKCKEMGLEYSKKEYTIQAIIFAVVAFVME